MFTLIENCKDRHEARTDQDILRMIPDLFQCSPILYVGAWVGSPQPQYAEISGFWMAAPLELASKHGAEVDVLEIWKPYTEKIAVVYPWLNEVLWGDIHDKVKPAAHYEAVIWRHGPEHLHRQRAITSIRNCERLSKKWVVILCPWGFELQRIIDDNPHQEHVSAWEPKDFLSRDYNVLARAFTKPCRKCKGQLLAWKKVSQS